MASLAKTARGDAPSTVLLERWPTGAKVFLILSAALLPLAIIAIFATLRTTQIANTEVRARLRVAASESSRKLAIELVGDMTALRSAVDALSNDAGDTPSCARTQGVFAQQFAAGSRFVVLDSNNRVLCGDNFPGAATIARAAASSAIVARIAVPTGLLLGVSAPGGTVRGAALFPTEFLADLGQPSGYSSDYGATLVDGDTALSLKTLVAESPLERRETNRTALGVGSLALEMQVRSAPINSPMVIAMLLPLIMWVAAASIAWFVVDRLLVGPLSLLRTRVAAFTPGKEIDVDTTRGLPAQEIRELGETFRAISRTVALHEAGLAEGLVRQTKLTREVHHRVKNNLQVIASLISLHARGARTADATRAYASIQRRVDALAVVHRNHFAEMEENRGLGLRSMLGELASNLRATAPDDEALGIVVDVDPLTVNQDVAVAVAFLVTETIELALSCDSAAKVRLSAKPTETEGCATLRISSPALIDGDTLRQELASRYGRVMEGLSRQLRAKLHHDPLAGAYEIGIPVIGIE